MPIGEAESRTGLDRATIRYYEREGLLSPRRMENGYRDYGEQEMTALLRIKLLRELGISLEDIRSLQQGTLALPQTLAVRIEQLEREISASTQAKETCRAIREEGVSYAALDEATKKAQVCVAYAKSMYAGSSNASTALAGEFIGILAGENPAEVKSGLEAAVSFIEEDACF